LKARIPSDIIGEAHKDPTLHGTPQGEDPVEGQGVFITFEGIEGTGKSTQMARVERALAETGREVLRTREPGGTRIGEDVRGILLCPENRSMAPLCELLLYEACRAQLVQETIRPALARGAVVLCDRFADATMAYQGYGRGIDRTLVAALNRTAMDGTEPDLTLLLDCPVELGLERVCGRLADGPGPGRLDRLEAEDLAFHGRVRRGYLAIAEESPERVRVVDGARDAETVHREILGHISRLLAERALHAVR